MLILQHTENINVKRQMYTIYDYRGKYFKIADFCNGNTFIRSKTWNVFKGNSSPVIFLKLKYQPEIKLKLQKKVC